MTAGSWQERSGCRTSDSSWFERVWNKQWDKMEEERSELVTMERSEGVIEAVVNGRATPVFQVSTWNEDEETMTGPVCSFGGKYFLRPFYG